MVDDPRRVGLTEDGGLHPVVEDLLGHAAEAGEGGDVTAQHRGEVLAGDEAAPQPTAVTQHHREQPDDPLDLGRVLEGGLEEGEVDLGLAAGRGLEATLERWLDRRTDAAHEAGDAGIAALEAVVAQLAPEALGGQRRVVAQPLAQIGRERLDRARHHRPRRVGGRLQAARDVLAHRLAVVPGLARDGGDRQALPGQFQDHHPLPEIDHRRLPRCRAAGSGIGATRPARSGEFSMSASGENSRSSYTAARWRSTRAW